VDGETNSEIQDKYYLFVKATQNRCILEWIKNVQDFMRCGAATLNAQSPYDLSRDTGTCNSI